MGEPVGSELLEPFFFLRLWGKGQIKSYPVNTSSFAFKMDDKTLLWFHYIFGPHSLN